MLHPFTVTDEDHCRPAHRLVTVQEMKGERKTPSAGLWVMWLPRFGVNNDRMTEGCTECIPSHTKLNNHCRCLHCIHCRVSLWQPLQHMRLLGSHSPTAGHMQLVSTVIAHLSCGSTPLPSLKPRPNRVTEKVVFSS